MLYQLAIISALAGSALGLGPLISGLPSSAFSWSDAHGSCQNSNPTFANTVSSWCAVNNANAATYLQVDLGDTFKIYEVATKGRPAHGQRVTAYKLSYSLDGSTFVEDGVANPLTGNTDANTEVRQSLGTAGVVAQYLRFTPTAYTSWKSMRIEAYGIAYNGAVCEALDIDAFLDPCSSLFAGVKSDADDLQDEVDTLDGKIEAVDDRVDNLIDNLKTFYSGTPTDSAAAKAVFAEIDRFSLQQKKIINDKSIKHGHRGNHDGDDQWLWFEQNKIYLMVFLAAMNVFSIIVGLTACFKAFGPAPKMRVVHYGKVVNGASDVSDDEAQLIN